MLPTSTSNRSYTQQKRQQNGRRPPVARSSSFLGAIKNIVTAPLSWFAQDDDHFEDTKGKRRRLGESGDAGVTTEDGGSRNKRMRIGSPERQPDQLGYLDPPRKIFQQPHSAPPGSGFASSPALPSYPASIGRSTSVMTPSHNVQRLPSRNNRHTVSPLRTSFTQADIISRTMSMDPPAGQSLTRDITMTPTRDSAHRYSMSMPRDASISPTRSPFCMRTSLTPQPSGSAFGPSLHQRREHASEPPTLEELMANPKFVRPPTSEPSHLRNEAKEPTITLGCLVDSQRSTRSPVRQHSTLLFGPSEGFVNGRPVNAAEKALYELDIYKTPLLPSRLRGSTTIPDMFKPKPKRSHTPILMHSEKDDKPRLGKSKGREVNGTKPYAGEGGMKKLLARRKLEEEDERRKEQAEAMDDGREEEDELPPPTKQGRSYTSKLAEEKTDSIIEERPPPPSVPPVPTFDSSSATSANYEKSSLRVGRTRTSRNHISRPTSRSNNRFSAVYEEEESDDQMLEEKSADQIALEEAAKKVPAFQVPAGFSFSKEAPQIQHDLTSAKEPPMSSLPFSFAKPANSPATSSVSPSPSKEPELAPTPASSVFVRPTPSDAPKAPSITLTTATPEHPKAIAPQPQVAPSGIPNFFANSEVLKRPLSTTPPETAGSGVPNFFANASALSKPASPSPPTTSSNVPKFFANSVAVNKPVAVAPLQTSAFSPAHATPTKDTDNPLWEGEKTEKPALNVAETKPLSLSFGEVHKPTTSSSLFGVPPTGSNSSISNVGSGTSHATSSIFASSTAPASVKGVDTAPAYSVFGGVQPPKPTESIPSPFQFGAPKVDEPTQQPAAGHERPKAAPAPVEAPKPPPVFGSAPVSSFAGFGGPTAGAAAAAAEAPKSAFSFGQPTSGASTPIEAPKPVFGSESAGGFSFGQRPSSAPTLDVRPPANPFSFGAAPSTPPAGAEKKAPFTFGPSPVAAAPATSSTFSFGPPSGSSHGTDVSHKPFAFGGAGAVPARPITPPKNEQEFRMEESPTRDMNGKAAEAPKPALADFSFGAPSASSTGSTLFSQNSQTSQGGLAPFSFGGAPSTPASNPFGAKPEKQENKGLGFGFGQNTQSSGFSFGQKPADAAPTTPSSTGGFSFGQAPVTAPTPISTSFAFGGPSSSSNLFSQSASNAGSAPNSPSTFNQSAPFSFTSPTAPSNPFAFGSSQPASPATNDNASLPQVPGTPSGGFAFGQSSASAPQSTSPFQAPPATLPAGGSLFTIGSAPPPAPSGGGRAIKKLPNRRITKR